MRFAAIAFFALVSFAAPAGPVFTNPLLPSGADPWVTTREGFYFYMQTTGNNLTIWKTRDVTDLRNATKKVVWTPPPSGPYSRASDLVRDRSAPLEAA